jgi:hypothetical protein
MRHAVFFQINALIDMLLQAAIRPGDAEPIASAMSPSIARKNHNTLEGQPSLPTPAIAKARL